MSISIYITPEEIESLEIRSVFQVTREYYDKWSLCIDNNKINWSEIGIHPSTLQEDTEKKVNMVLLDKKAYVFAKVKYGV